MRKEIIPIARIAQSILHLRGEKVILVRDLAVLYSVETRVLNHAVKRNMNRFPDDFVFQLFSKQVRAFTEQRIAMLSSVLNSERAVKVNIAIMRAFVRLSQTLETNRELAQKFADLERSVEKHDEDISAIIEAIRQLMAPPEKPRREIGFHVRERTARYRTRKVSIRHA